MQSGVFEVNFTQVLDPREAWILSLGSLIQEGWREAEHETGNPEGPLLYQIHTLL